MVARCRRVRLKSCHNLNSMHPMQLTETLIAVTGYLDGFARHADRGDRDRQSPPPVFEIKILQIVNFR
jgi:hypothetical protein